MVKKSFTLIELIFVIVILSLITIGSFKAIQMLYERYYQVNTITKFSILSQTTLDEVSSMLYYRIPLTAIGYSSTDGDFKQLQDVDDDKYSIFEWISEAYDAKKHMGLEGLAYGYSGFIDLDASNKDTLTLVAKDFNITDVNNTLNKVFNNNQDLNKTAAIIFAGDLDEGEVSADYNNSFGWHGHEHNRTYLIHALKQVDNDANLTMTNDINGSRIYAKYYLASSAWAIARGADINKSAECIKKFNIKSSELNNTLFIFYNYRPWNLETFCADPHHDGKETNEGNVSILAKNITYFGVRAINAHLELKIQFTKPLYRGNEKNITLSKQKATF